MGAPKVTKFGRPTKLNEEVIKRAKDYSDNWKTIYPEDIIPTIEGLCLHCGLARDTVYSWYNDGLEDDAPALKKDFSYIFRDILSNQSKKLLNGGLSGVYNSTITKVMLTKHGYRDAQEITGKDGKDLTPPTIQINMPK